MPAAAADGSSEYEKLDRAISTGSMKIPNVDPMVVEPINPAPENRQTGTWEFSSLVLLNGRDDRVEESRWPGS